MISTTQVRLTRGGAGLAVLAGAGVIVLPLTGLAAPAVLASLPGRVMLFYAVTAAAYALLPYVRRGDVACVAMWLVLAAGVAPCLRGEEIAAPVMFADMAGVALAAAPIYIARFRQVLQGDLRPQTRRASDGRISF